MIAHILNAVLGLGLAYAAILDPSLISGSRWPMTIAGAAILVLGLIARPGERLKWAGSTDVVLGAILAVVALSGAIAGSAALGFWIVLWTGVIVAIVSLWSSIYRPAALP
jgi:hypothetical protein